MLQPLLPVLVLLGAIAAVVGNYQCLCSYHVERGMYQQPSAVSAKLGHMYEFDCQPLVTSVTSPPGWAAIAYKHQVGYVEVDQNAVTTVCQGTYPAADRLTTSSPISTTSASPPPVKLLSSTSTAANTRSPTTVYKIMPSSTTTATTTTTPTTTTTAFTPTTTTTPTTSTPTTTTTTTTTTPRNTSLCPAILHQYAREDKAALTQYDQSCYELVPIRTIWYKAENDCRAKGGHLFHISNQAEQDFIYQFIKSYHFDHAVWTGLHDLANEEYFEWISGDHVIYTNWYADRLGNMASHYIEDCVLFVPYAPYFGKWDDVVCGTETIFHTNVGQQNPFICQYPIHPQPQRVTGLPLVGKRLAT